MDAQAAAREWACQQQAVRFFHLLDAKVYDEIVELFEPDGTWCRPGHLAGGRVAITAALQQRPPNRVTRHLVTNFLVTQSGADEVQACCTLATFARDSTIQESPRLVDALAGLYSARFTFRCSGAGTRIASLDLAPQMVFGR